MLLAVTGFAGRRNKTGAAAPGGIASLDMKKPGAPCGGRARKAGAACAAPTD